MSNRECLSVLESELGLDNFKKFRSIVKRFTCKEAIVMLALNGAPLVRAAELKQSAKMVKSHAEFCHDVCRCLRAVRRYKSLTETSGLLRILVNNLRNQAGKWYQCIVAEVAPDCVLEDETYDWARLRPGELDAIESRLRYEKISETDLDEAVALIFVSPSALFTNHLCLFSFPAFRSQSPSDPLLPFLKSVNYDLESVIEFFGDLKALGTEELVERLHQMAADQLARITPPTGRIADFVFSASKDWPAFRSVCVEHFGDLIPTNLVQPDHWHDLVENSRCVVALILNQMIGRAFESAEHSIRQFAAITECLRHRHSLTDSTDHHGLQERIKATVIPYGVCAADTKAWFGYVESQGEQYWEFDLACSPFGDLPAFDELTISDLSVIIDHIDQGRGDMTLWRAVEHFEGALSLGGVSKTLSESLESVWKIAALWTALEVRTPGFRTAENRSGPIADYLRNAFRSAGLSESQCDQGANLVRNLYGLRNDAVHEGRTRIDGTDLVSYRNVVATLLGIELRAYAQRVRGATSQ